jgi:hypothetical protein
MQRVKSLSSARWQRWSEIQPTPFRQVYDFILHAVNGDKATADAIFGDYLAGKLSEELLSTQFNEGPPGFPHFFFVSHSKRALFRV